MIRDFHGIIKKRLVDEINELQNILPPDQWRVLDSIRRLGNIGAHPEKDINLISEVESGEVEKMIKVIEEMEENKKVYKFNVFGMGLTAFNRKYARKNSFYCAEFVKYILDEGGVDVSTLPSIIKPQDFTKLENLEVVYEGLLREYPYKNFKL